MNIFKRTALLIFIMTGLYGCTDTSSNPSENTEEIWPLKVGNQWIYRIHIIDSIGAAERIVLDTTTVIDSKTIDNEIWYDIYQNGIVQLKIYFKNRPDGLWAIHKAESALVYKFPAKVGDILFENEDEKLEVISTDTSITTPAGIFKCYAYKETDYREIFGEIEITEKINYVSPNIGPVAASVQSSNGIKSRSELIRYTLK
ncbi:MAG TPA: hypothetical protein VEC36_02680 [Patescibacteria group bacterium]|nr:hypothetical protein [Patescibacteria group bacterium]